MRTGFQIGINIGIVIMLVFVGFAALPATKVSSEALSSDISQDIISPLKVYTNKPYYKQGEDISVFINNRGKTDIMFDIMPKFKIYNEDGEVVYPPAYVKNNPWPMQAKTWCVGSGDTETNMVSQSNFLTEKLDPGTYTIVTESILDDVLEGRHTFGVRGMGYVLLVAGNNNDDMQFMIDAACNQIFDDLLDIGYPSSRVYYLNSWNNWRVDGMATSATMETAIDTWAAGKVSEHEPLFIIMFDHGNVNKFCIDDPPTDDQVWAWDLEDWIDDLETDTDADVYTWYMGCHSGSFIDDLTGDGRITITSSNADENSGGAPAPYYEKFSNEYWPAIKSGDSLGAAFNTGSQYVAGTLNSYHPLLDDNGDGVGHGWDTPAFSGYLPHDGDGDFAAHIYMGGPIIRIPWIEYVIEKRSFIWPIPPELEVIPVEAEIDAMAAISKVTACIIPLIPLTPNYQTYEYIEHIDYDNYEMSDPDGDGTWSVNIPISAFKNHVKGPTDIEIMIIAEDENGHSAIPCETEVEFSRTGQVSVDYTAPGLRIQSPKYLENVQGAVTISAVAMDDTCLEKAEIYVGDNLVGTINLPASSNFGFDYPLDTSDLNDGFNRIEIRVYDAAGNTYSQSTIVAVVNNAVSIPPETFKDYTAYYLESAKTGDKKIDSKLDKIIELIEASLDSELWEDLDHLDPKHGHKVFSLEKQAVQKLEELMNHKNVPNSVVQACINARINLVYSDWLLAKTALDEAVLNAGASKKVDHEIAMAQQKMQDSYEFIMNENYGSAIDSYRQCWEHALKAV
ncbi:MAG: hypothetical protein JSV49_02805 [Thermoplasmata archaeon]|nr:MAG: hypothetical protein JSV49_02805 [Thermoplasmata archaeon]